jgi:hypothetical protein
MSLMSEVAFEYKGTRHAFESMSEPEAADLAWKLECHRDRGLPIGEVIVDHCDAYGLPCTDRDHEYMQEQYGCCDSCGQWAPYENAA